MKCYLMGAKHRTGVVNGNSYDNIMLNFTEQVDEKTGWGYMPVLIQTSNNFNGQTTVKTNVVVIKTKDLPNVVQQGVNLLDPSYKGRLFELFFDLHQNLESVRLCQK